MLDTNQKRGSAINLGMPGRQWLAEPSDTPDPGSLQSLLTFCSDPLFALRQIRIRGCVHVNDYAATILAITSHARTIVGVNDYALTTVSVNDEAC